MQVARAAREGAGGSQPRMTTWGAEARHDPTSNIASNDTPKKAMGSGLYMYAFVFYQSSRAHASLKGIEINYNNWLCPHLRQSAKTLVDHDPKAAVVYAP
jgi:hypothetical protein